MLAWTLSCGVGAEGSVVKSALSELVSPLVDVNLVPVRGSFGFLDFFFFCLVVAACPAVSVNRVLGPGKGMCNVMRWTYRIVVVVERSLPSLQGEVSAQALRHPSQHPPPHQRFSRFLRIPRDLLPLLLRQF